MDKYTPIDIDKNIIQCINASRLSASQRDVAISTMRHAELVVDAFVWVGKKIEQFSAHLFLKPGLKQ